MTAQIIEFPHEVAADRWAAAVPLRESAQVLILPVVKIDHEDSIRAKRRRAYLDMKAALQSRPLELLSASEIRGCIANLTNRERAELDTLLTMETI